MDAAFVAIGHEPNTALFTGGVLERDGGGHLATRGGGTRPGRRRLAAGDADPVPPGDERGLARRRRSTPSGGWASTAK